MATFCLYPQGTDSLGSLQIQAWFSDPNHEHGKKKQQNSVPGHHPASIGSSELCELLPFSCLVGQLSYLCNKLTCSITYSFLQVVSVEYCCQAGPVPGCGDVSQPSVVEKAAAGDIGIPY